MPWLDIFAYGFALTIIGFVLWAVFDGEKEVRKYRGPGKGYVGKRDESGPAQRDP